MDHVRPDFEGDGDVGRARRSGEAGRVAEQRLGRPDLDQRRREPVQVGVERRDARVLPVNPGGDIGVRKLDEIALVDEGIAGVLARHRRFRHRQVRPGRDEPDAGWGGGVVGEQPVDERDGEARAGAVAADHDVRGHKSLPAQERPGLESIVVGRGKRMFGRQPVLDRERPDARRPARFRHHPAMTQN